MPQDRDTPHGRLIGLDDAVLTIMAPRATHQHRKGGLYRDLGIIVDADTGKALTHPDGSTLRGWEHVHPHAVQVFARTDAESDRFRPLDVSAPAPASPV